jgi:hypothetical protein
MQQVVKSHKTFSKIIHDEARVIWTVLKKQKGGRLVARASYDPTTVSYTVKTVVELNTEDIFEFMRKVGS